MADEPVAEPKGNALFQHYVQDVPGGPLRECRHVYTVQDPPGEQPVPEDAIIHVDWEFSL